MTPCAPAVAEEFDPLMIGLPAALPLSVRGLGTACRKAEL